MQYQPVCMIRYVEYLRIENGQLKSIGCYFGAQSSFSVRSEHRVGAANEISRGRRARLAGHAVSTVSRRFGALLTSSPRPWLNSSNGTPPYEDDGQSAMRSKRREFERSSRQKESSSISVRRSGAELKQTAREVFIGEKIPHGVRTNEYCA